MADTYKLNEAAHITTMIDGESVDFDFSKGTHTPKSEGEEAALKLAVEAQEHNARLAELNPPEAAEAAPVVEEPDA